MVAVSSDLLVLDDDCEVEESSMAYNDYCLWFDDNMDYDRDAVGDNGMKFVIKDAEHDINYRMDFDSSSVKMKELKKML